MAKKATWSECDLIAAIDDIKSNKMSYRVAESKYNIPRATLHDYVSGKVEIGRKCGPHTMLTPVEEKALVEYIFEMSKIGYGQTKVQVLEMVQKVVERDGRETLFNNGRPGKRWWELFRKRHPEISLRVPEPLQITRAKACTPDIISAWFIDFGQFLDLHGLKDLPAHIWNADESGFPLCSRTGKVVAPRNTRAVYSITSNSKEQITCLCAGAADGSTIPPMHIFAGERFRYNPMENCVPGAYFGRSKNGWMTTELFFGWLSNHFARHVTIRPVVLLVDGHSTHIDIEVSKFCHENDIFLYCFPPHALHVLQPLDVNFFKSLKSAWGKECEQFNQRHPGSFVDKKCFSEVFRNAWTSTVSVSLLVNAFRSSGICPLNPSAINKDKVGPSLLYSGQKEISNPPGTEKDANHIALEVVEKLIDPDTIHQYQTRLQEGYDVQDDGVYDLWAKMKSLTISDTPPDDRSGIVRPAVCQPDDQQMDSTNVPVSEPTKESPTVTGSKNPCPGTSVLDEILVYPNPPQPKRQTKGTAGIPKHLSGEQMIRLLEEKENKKKQLEEDKLKRKELREKKKQERQLEKERKRHEKELQKERKQERSASRGRGRGRRGRGRGRDGQQRKASSSENLNEETGIPGRRHLLRQQGRECATSGSSDESCNRSGGEQLRQECDSSEDTDTECKTCGCQGNTRLKLWVACDACESWYHVECTGIDPTHYGHLEALDYVCDECID